MQRTAHILCALADEVAEMKSMIVADRLFSSHVIPANAGIQ